MARTVRSTSYNINRRERQQQYTRMRSMADRRIPIFDEDLADFLNEKAENSQIIECYAVAARREDEQ